MIKCPACAANNSAKRQICHMCGQLLSAQPENLGSKESLQLVSDELKAAAEAAMKEVSKTARTEPPEPESTLTAPPKARAEKLPRDRKGKEKVTVIVAAVITLIAIGYLIYWFLPKKAGPDFSSAVEGERTTALPPPPEITYEAQLPPSATPPTIKPAPAVAPAAPTEEETVAEEEEAAGEEIEETSIAAIEKTAATAVQPYIPPIISIVEQELETSLSAGISGYQGFITQQGDNTSVVTVSFQGKTLHGSLNVLMRKSDQGWKAGWQATHYKDFLLTFTTPVIVVTGADEVEESIVGANVGFGGFEPLENLNDPDVSIEYIYGY